MEKTTAIILAISLAIGAGIYLVDESKSVVLVVSGDNGNNTTNITTNETVTNQTNNQTQTNQTTNETQTNQTVNQTTNTTKEQTFIEKNLTTICVVLVMLVAVVATFILRKERRLKK